MGFYQPSVGEICEQEKAAELTKDWNMVKIYLK